MQTRIITSIGKLSATFGVPVQTARETLARRGVKPELVINDVEHFGPAAFAALAAEKAATATAGTSGKERH